MTAEIMNIGEDEALVVRQEFGGKQIARSAETASTAVAAQAKAAIEARYVMALQRPRDWDAVRLRVLKDCSRPSFAETAWYRRPVGKKKNERTGKWEDSFAEGFSIRFAEAAMRAMGNLYPEVMTIFDDQRKRIVRVVVTDLEDNLSYSVDVMVEKTVERSNVKEGQTVLSQRVNSYGKPVFLVEANEGELTVKLDALVSKAMRKCGLRLLPGDIQDEAKAKIFEVRNNEAARDPDAARRKLIEAFNWYGVTPDMLAVYVGHPVATLSPAEIVELQGVYLAVKEGEKWAEIMKAHEPDEQAETATPTAPKTKPKSLADVVANEKAKKATKPAREPGDDDEPPRPSEDDYPPIDEAELARQALEAEGP